MIQKKQSKVSNKCNTTIKNNINNISLWVLNFNHSTFHQTMTSSKSAIEIIRKVTQFWRLVVNFGLILLIAFLLSTF